MIYRAVARAPQSATRLRATHKRDESDVVFKRTFTLEVVALQSAPFRFWTLIQSNEYPE